MVTDKLKQLAVARAAVAELEQSIAADLNRELASLPANYGFANAKAFLAAVRAASGGKRGPRQGRKVAASKSTGAKRRKRAVITDKIRAQVKKLVETGKTGTEIAKTVGISLPSVQNIKTALGLVKKQK